MVGSPSIILISKIGTFSSQTLLDHEIQFVFGFYWLEREREREYETLHDVPYQHGVTVSTPLHFLLLKTWEVQNLNFKTRE